ncbi:DUF6786 family protein [Flavihumibacter sp. CACIAM 22H1]|uniref:DUF6786 family protein n=1 Tax=Flavihumibacter sp. CACIAM 22H1 TaxID=1812911 RepID=UPI0007A7EE63|nr:DUF6786 family protein [Flavihumibacter sp. CACIAM 22H1]KYP14199.1 MAG: hypothetical protein A1D16_01510 [Flavihumibacter sp. CACIAM 22H1]
MKQAIWFYVLAMGSALVSCTNTPKNDTTMRATTTEYAKGSLGYDKAFLKKYDSSLVELKLGAATVLVSAKYQAKVFTSGAKGANGPSFGWINYKAFDAPIDAHMNAYGGENRFWLGPEGGNYSVFFQPGTEMVFDNWKTPAAIDTESWTISHQSDSTVLLQKQMTITNYQGTELNMQVERSISIASKEVAEASLGVKLGDSIVLVGYHTSNQLTNTGSFPWTVKTGMPCIWILDMFTPSDATTIVIPFKPGKATDKIATTDYFGQIPPDRIKLTDKTLFFKADGKSRGKLGILPKHVLPLAGSYDATNKLLTITQFSVDNKARYLNQEWTTTKPTFSGDAMNAYNDGPLANGSQMGPFYELESVSPAAALATGEKMRHQHNVYHFTGSVEQLNTIAQQLLGVGLEEIKKAF